MTSKDRAKLRGLANSLDPVVYVGKEGVTEIVISEADKVLEKRELIKVQVQNGCDETPREVADIFAKQLFGEIITVVGKRFVIYREAEEDSQHLI
jgi:RNA-binding protein